MVRDNAPDRHLTARLFTKDRTLVAYARRGHLALA